MKISILIWKGFQVPFYFTILYEVEFSCILTKYYTTAYWIQKQVLGSRYLLLKYIWSWRGGSAVKNTCYSESKPCLGSQYPHGGSQAFIPPIPGNPIWYPLLTSSGTGHTCDTQTCRQNTHTHQINKSIFFQSEIWWFIFKSTLGQIRSCYTWRENTDLW